MPRYNKLMIRNMRKFILPIFFIAVIFSNCIKSNLANEIPDISGEWYMQVQTAQVQINNTTTVQYGFPHYLIILKRINTLEYSYEIQNMARPVSYTGTARYNHETDEFFFDSYYAFDIFPDLFGNFSGKFNKHENRIEGNLFVPVFLFLGVGQSKIIDTQTTFEINK